MADKILDFVQKRKEVIEEKRRSFERILFQNLLGVYSVINQDGSIYPVTLVDISREGCLFQVPWNIKKDKKFEDKTELTLRMYFTKKSFIPVVVNIKYGHEFIDHDGITFMRYGAEFDKSMPSFEALGSFIEFLYKFAEYSAVDQGDPKTYFL